MTKILYARVVIEEIKIVSKSGTIVTFYINLN